MLSRYRYSYYSEDDDPEELRILRRIRDTVNTIQSDIKDMKKASNDAKPDVKDSHLAIAEKIINYEFVAAQKDHEIKRLADALDVMTKERDALQKELQEQKQSEVQPPQGCVTIGQGPHVTVGPTCQCAELRQELLVRDKLIGEADVAAVDREETIQKLHAEVANLRSKQSALQKTIESYNEDINYKARQIDRMHNKINEKDNQLIDVESSLDDAKERVDTLVADNAYLRKLNEQCHDEIAQKNKAIQVLGDTLRRNEENSHKNYQDLLDDRDSIKAKKNQFKKQFLDFQDKCQWLQVKFDESTKQTGDLKEQIEGLNDYISVLEKQASDYRGDILAYKKTLDVQTAACQRNVDRLVELAKKKEELQMQNEELQKKVQQAEAIRSDLLKMVTAFKN